ELAVEVDHGNTGAAGVGDGQGRVVDRHHAGPGRVGLRSAVLRHGHERCSFLPVGSVLRAADGSQAAGGDVAVGGGGVDGQVGGAVGVLERVVDPAVGGAGVQGRGDSVGGADPDVATPGAQGDRAAQGLGDPDVAPRGTDLGGTAEPADLDGAVDDGQA